MAKSPKPHDTTGQAEGGNRRDFLYVATDEISLVAAEDYLPLQLRKYLLLQQISSVLTRDTSYVATAKKILWCNRRYISCYNRR